MTGRILVLMYGIAAYVAFVATFLYAAGFVGGFVSPTTLDGERDGSLPEALLVNLGLLGLFALQHSGMARPAFKDWLERFLPRAVERSTYVLLSSLALLLLFWLWRPIGGIAWQVDSPVWQAVLYAVFAAGWLIVLVSSFLINHFDLFGLRQVWMYYRGQAYTPLPFTTPGPYRWVRHPLYVGWLLGFWAIPTMTVSHLVFAIATTAYILIAIRWEERDLLTYHAEYADYRRRVPMLVPLKPKGVETPVG